MDVYYLFYGENEYGYIMVKTGKNLCDFDQAHLDTFMRAETSRIYFAQIPYQKVGEKKMIQDLITFCVHKMYIRAFRKGEEENWELWHIKATRIVARFLIGKQRNL